MVGDALMTSSLPFVPQRGDMASYSESLFPESDVITHARARGQEFGIPNTEQLIGSLIRYLAELIGASAVVEVGTGTGVSGLYLLELPHLTLTSIDAEMAHAKAARLAFDEAEISPTRYRLITGATKEVIGKLADNSYDIFVMRQTRDSGDSDYLVDALGHAERSLRPGGLLILDAVLGGGKVADPTQRDDQSIARREVIRAIRASKKWRPLLLPLADGVMVATKSMATE
ncbi:MAG: methyltransferase domain-containing protein [Actinobacteria bacterium]|nr:methyltransferase domain-containing protein [Actinomycetota bacterium]